MQERFENGGMIEVLFNLYAETGNSDYLELGKKFGKPSFFNGLAQRRDSALRVHGNVHTPLVIGMARHYEVTGDERSRGLCEFFWDRIANTRSYATGGSTVCEGWGKANELAGTLCASTVESCVVYNMLKLTRHLLCWTGEARYGDCCERNYFNHILGSMGKNGAIRTYAQSLASGYHKKNHGPTSCCYGTGMESFSKLGDSIYFHSDGALYVNQYIASRLAWPEQGLTLTQHTRFPEEDTMRFAFECKRPVRLAMSFRIPSLRGPVGDVLKRGGCGTTCLPRVSHWQG